MHKRHHINEVHKRIVEPLLFIQVIVGPRQVGKTTMVNQMLSEITIPWAFEPVDAVPAGTPQWIEQL